jgi:hypothetical protein
VADISSDISKINTKLNYFLYKLVDLANRDKIKGKKESKNYSNEKYTLE